MSRDRGQPGAWLLALLMCLQAVVPAAGGRWLLCVGCDGGGYGVGLGERAGVEVSVGCCGQEPAGEPAREPGGERERPAAGAGDQDEACGCLRLRVDGEDAPAVPGSWAGADVPVALGAEAPAVVVRACGAGDRLRARGPPWPAGDRAGRTLLAQRTLLLT